uniref:T9SS type A sorting domain-containing protein n=1 Tax=Aestuariivivens marinum TaxID=2913555 RepID=UPI001F56CFBC
ASILWDDPLAQTTATATDLAAGDYNVLVTDTNGCTATLPVTVDPAVPMTCLIDPLPLACEGSDIQLNVTAGGGTGIFTYVWSSSNASVTFGDANGIDNTLEDPIAYGAQIDDIFYVAIYDENQCVKTCQITANLYNCTPNCGTAFAVRTQDVGGYDSVVEDDTQETYSSCFRNDGFKRWGWTNTITEYGTYTYAVYRGAGRCDLSKGTYVGDLIVDYQYDNDLHTGVVNFSYDLLTKVIEGQEVPLFLVSEVHLFVGCDPYPFKGNAPDDIYSQSDEVKGEYYTVAPGQYPYNANIPDGTYHSGWQATKTGVTGSFYFIAHAVICDRDIPYPDDMHIPGEKRDYDEIDLEGNSSFMDTECTVDTGGWGKLEDKKVSFTAYPVPFQNEVNIGYKFEYDTDVKIDVYDIKGALIREAENTNYVKGTYDSTKIDLSYTEDQMYFVRLTTKEGTLVKKIISSKPQ